MAARGATTTPDVPASVATPEVVSASEEAQRSLLNVMRDKFAAEKRVPVKIRNDGDVFVQVQGYSFLIKPNVKVEVPESLVPILEEAGYI